MTPFATSPTIIAVIIISNVSALQATCQTDKIIWKETFENYQENATWNPKALKGRKLTKIVMDDSLHSKVLQVKYRAGEIWAQGSKVGYKKSLPGGDTYISEYDLKFPKGFEFKRGGKLPGMCGGRCTTGCLPIHADGWSARFMWRENGRIVLYLYHQNRPGRCGEDFDLNFKATPGKWFHIKSQIKIDSPDKDNGSIKIWVNGKEALEKNDLRLRGATDGALIDKFNFVTFYGGSDSIWAPNNDNYAYFDNIVICKP